MSFLSRVIFAAALSLAATLLFAAGCAHAPRESDESARIAALEAQPTPASWRPGVRWVFVEVDANGTIRRSVTLRVTDANAKSYLADGEWRAMEWITQVPDGPRNVGSPIHLATGRRLIVEFSNQFHDSWAYVGELGDAGFSGKVRTSNYTYGDAPGRWHPDVEKDVTVVGVPMVD